MEPTSPKPTGKEIYSSNPALSEQESGDNPAEYKKEIPEPEALPTSTFRDLSKASPLVKPGYEGLKHLKGLSPEQLLPIVFDQKALTQWENYHSEEKGKGQSLVNSWIFMVDAISNGRFTSPSELESLLQDLHSHSFEHGPRDCSGFSSTTYRAGDFRYIPTQHKVLKQPVYGHDAPCVKKYAESECSEATLYESKEKLDKACQLAGLPELPPFCFRVFINNKDIYLAVPVELAVKLYQQPPGSRAEAQAFMEEVAAYYCSRQDLDSYLQALNKVNPHELSMVLGWKYTLDKFKGKGGYSLVHSTINAMIPRLQQEGIAFLRYNELPDKFIRAPLDHWFSETSAKMQGIQTEAQLYETVSTSILELLSLRPFPDANTRVAILWLQGMLIGFGYRPLALSSRYIFNMGQKALEETIKTEQSPEELRNLRITSNLLPFLNRVRSRTEIRGLNPLFV